MKITITIEDASAHGVHAIVEAMDALQKFGHLSGAGPKKLNAAVDALTTEERRDLAWACHRVAMELRKPLRDAECKSTGS